MDFRVVNVNWGFWVGLYQMGDKSGIWKFYGWLWKNIFYERLDKERKKGFKTYGSLDVRAC